MRVGSIPPAISRIERNNNTTQRTRNIADMSRGASQCTAKDWERR